MGGFRDRYLVGYDVVGFWASLSLEVSCVDLHHN